MSEITLQNAQRMAVLLSGVIKGMSLYPVGHPAVRQPLQDIMTMLLASLQGLSEVRMGVNDGIFFIEEHLFVNSSSSEEELAKCLSEKGISGITISRGLRLEEMTCFISLLARKNLGAAELERLLEDKGVANIRLTIITDEGDSREDGESEARETYNQALDAIRGVFKEIETGRIPNSDKVIRSVNRLATMTIQEPAALLGLAMIKDYDNYTFNHSVNVGVLSMALGTVVGLSREETEELGMGGFLHDIGKTQVEKSILNKPGRLSAAEFEVMKKHPENGSRIVSEMSNITPRVPQVILGHHIRHNRQGYPEWARKMPLDSMSEIIAVADCYDAITTLRVYQRPINPKAALDELHNLAGSYLDVSLVNKFLELMGKYPVGTLVRLDNNEIAVVFRPNPANSDAPVVKVIMDANGGKLEHPVVQRLSDDAGNSYADIVAVVDPLLKNIDVGIYIT
jgi:HD-GYP domain-containing protein (c-di-GMP phosphodiesterase class II)